MKKLLTAIILSTTAATVNAADIFGPDMEIYDCNIAAETAMYAAETKASGITINEVLKLTREIPPSYQKEFYINFTALGFKYDNKQEAFDAGYQMCTEHKASS